MATEKSLVNYYVLNSYFYLYKKIHYNNNPSPAEPGYTLPLQKV